MKMLMVMMAATFALVNVAFATLPHRPKSALRFVNPAQLRLIHFATHHSVDVLRSFDSGISGLTGYVIADKHKNSRPVIIYVDQKARYMVIGAVINKKGINLNYVNTERYITAAQNTKAYADLKNTVNFVEGNAQAPHKLTVIVDPNCGYCHRFYLATRSFVASGQLAIRWVMVGFLKPSSLLKSARIVSAKSHVSLLSINERHFNRETETGGLNVKPNAISPTMQKAIARNNAYFKAHQFAGTPVLLFLSHNKATVIPGFMGHKALQKRLVNMDGHF